MPTAYLLVPLATLVYLLVDVYPVVKSFSGIVRTVSFVLLWAIFSILNVIAYAAWRLAASAKIQAVLGDASLTELTVIILSTLSTLTILQSFTLKVADYKFVDVGAWIETFRKRVLADIGEQVGKQTKINEQRVADLLYAKFQHNPQALRDEYANVMAFGGRTVAQIGQELTQLQQDAAAINLSFEKLLASRIVKADIQRAEHLV